MGYSYLSSLSYFIPELIVSLTMLFLILIESSYQLNANSKKLFYWCASLGLITSLVYTCTTLGFDSKAIFTNSLVIDSFGSFSKIIMILGTLFSVLLASKSKDLQPYIRSEFSILAVGVLVGGMLLASASNMLILFIGMETLSILSYALASLKKNSEKSSEAGLKYSLYGGVSSAFMLFGMSHIFGTLGTINFIEINKLITEINQSQLIILLPSFLLFFVGIGYKISSVPFHMWTPDVYEGSPLPVTMFFSIVPKIAGISFLARVTLYFFENSGFIQTTWLSLLGLIAALTMTVGNLCAINQKSIKRMLAYSSISHAGVMMMGAVVLNKLGFHSILFYGFTYVFMTVVAFFITSFVQDNYGNDYFERFDGFIYRYPLMAICMLCAMLSLAGIPPFVGFIAKFNILNALIKNGDYSLAVITGINSVIAVYYYMKIVRIMIFKQASDTTEIKDLSIYQQGIIALSSLPLIYLGIKWSGLYKIVSNTNLSIF